MGTLSNTNAVSMTVPAAAMAETPTHFTVWNHATAEAADNFVTQGALLDDDTGATPVFDVAEDGTITFDAGDLTFPTTVNANLGERFYQDALKSRHGLARAAAYGRAGREPHEQQGDHRPLQRGGVVATRLSGQWQVASCQWPVNPRGGGELPLSP